MSKYPQELLDAMEDAVDAHGMAYLNHQNDGRTSMQAALEAADKWREEQAAKHVAGLREEIAKLKDERDALSGKWISALDLRDEWKARHDDAQTQLTGLREYAASILATLAEARATIGESWFSGDATLAQAIRRKCMTLEENACEEKVPVLPYEEDAKLVEACCRAFFFTDLTETDPRSEMRKLLRFVREHHQAHAKAQAVAEPEPKVEYATREEVDAIKSALTSALLALTQIDGGAAFSGLLESSMSTLLSTSATKEPTT